MAAGRRGNGEGSVFKRGDGRWCAVLDTPTGKKYFTGKKRADVVARFEAAKIAGAQNRLVGTGKQTVRDYLDSWVTSKTDLRYNSEINYRAYLANLIPALGAMPLCEVTPDHIDAAYAELTTRYSGTTVHATHRVFKAALARAVQRGVLARNPCDLVTPPRGTKAPIVCLDLAQVRQLITGSEGQPYRALWCLLVTTGLRSGEARGLQWGDIDFEARRLTVKRQCQRASGSGLELLPLKSVSAERTVPVPQTVLAMLAEHRRVQRDLRAQVWSWQYPEIVFPNDHGGLLHAGQLMKHWRRTLELCGLPYLRLHDLRHTAITNWLREPGMYLKQVSVRAGHSNPTITLSIYSHVMPDMGSNTAAWLDEVLAGG